MFPKSGNMLVVPTLLFAQRPRKIIRSIDVLGAGIVVPQRSKDRSGQVFFENAIDASLRVLDIFSRHFLDWIMRHKITSIKRPSQGILILSLSCPSQGPNRLKGSKAKIIRRVTLESSVRRCREEDLIPRSRVEVVVTAAQSRRTITLRADRVPRIQMKIGKMQHLDPLPARLGNPRACWLGLREKTSGVQGPCRWQTAEGLAQCMANIVPIKALDISEGQHLCPDGTEDRRSIVFFAGGI
jgi:hypothetical protein